MTRAAISPFSFNEFDASPASDSIEKSFSAEDIDTAFKRGEAKGRAQQAADNDVAINDHLGAIESALSKTILTYRNELEAEKSHLRETTHVFCSEFLMAHSMREDLAIASNLIDQFLEESHSQFSAILYVSKETFQSASLRLTTIINSRDVRDFISLSIDPELAPGSCRLDWKSGSLSFSPEQFRAKIFELLSQSKLLNEA